VHLAALGTTLGHPVGQGSDWRAFALLRAFPYRSAHKQNMRTTSLCRRAVQRYI